MFFKRKFTWIDLTLIIILVVAIAGISYKFAKSNVASTTAERQKLLITFSIDATPDTTIKALNIGDPVIETVQSSDFGKIVSIEQGPSIYWESRDDGQLVSSSREGFSSLNLTMEAYGVIKDNGVYIDKASYYVGLTISLYAGKSYLSGGRISAISVAE